MVLEVLSAYVSLPMLLTAVVVLGVVMIIQSVGAKKVDAPGPPFTFFFGNMFEVLANIDRIFDWGCEYNKKFEKEGCWAMSMPGAVEVFFFILFYFYFILFFFIFFYFYYYIIIFILFCCCQMNLLVKLRVLKTVLSSKRVSLGTTHLGINIIFFC